MGYNTPLLIYNDSLGLLKSDPNIASSIDDAISKSYMTREPEIIYGINCSLGLALPSEHADVSRTVVFGGNSAVEVGKGHWTDIPYKEDKMETYLRNLVEGLGYKLVKKNKKS